LVKSETFPPVFAIAPKAGSELTARSVKISNVCGNGSYCNNGLQISSQKSYSCVAPALLNAQNESLSLEFDLKSGTGNITVYAKLTGAPLEFNCTVGNCTTLGNTIVCESTACLCTTWCTSFVSSLVSNIKGKTTFACDPQGACSLVNAPLLSSKFQCIASSCDALGPSTSTSFNSTYQTSGPSNSTQTATSSNTTHQSETISKGPTYQTTVPSNQTHATGIPSGSSGPCTTIPKQDCIEVCGAGNVKVCQCIHGEPYVQCITGASALLTVSWILASLAILLA